MWEWQHFLQSIAIGIVFAFLLSKLISVFASFQQNKLTVTRSSDQSQIEPITSMSVEVDASASVSKSGSGSDKDDEWESIEASELDEAFREATTFIANLFSDGNAANLSEDVQLHLYGLYKIATQGPCTEPSPAAFRFKARAKWLAWHKLGCMSPEDAMQRYIDAVTAHYPSWQCTPTKGTKNGEGKHNTHAKRSMGPVFSTFLCQEESENDLKLEAIHAYAREGDISNLIRCISDGVSVDMKDSEGRTPLHWAVDRGHFDIVEILANKNCDINAEDNEGQMPLHYAVICEREAIAKYLVEHGASLTAKDRDGMRVTDLSGLNWPFLKPS